MTSIAQTQSSQLPPAQPVYVLRGHSAQVHALQFLRENLRLLSGDAEGWVVLWNIPTRRPVAVWKAHKNSILGLGSWGDDKIITHGRDNKLCVWQLKAEEESSFSTTLPIDDSVSERKQPWLLHALEVNAINFCSFTMLKPPAVDKPSQDSGAEDSILITTPGVQDGHVNITSLPSEERIATIPSPPDAQTGMLMAIGMCYVEQTLTVLAGYESGHTAIWQQSNSTQKWKADCVNKIHTQPVLSLNPKPNGTAVFSSSADAIIGKQRLRKTDFGATKTIQTKHAGQQSLTVRSDGKIFATAGWDGRVRVYSAKSMKELAVLKWHKEGCYATAFAQVRGHSEIEEKSGVDDSSVVKRDLTVSEQRVEKAKSTHWLAAGSKDGKISLWDIY